MKKGFIALLVVLLLLTACGPTTPTADNKKTFLGGTTGLLINFVDQEPPAEVTDGGATPFTVTVKLENTGETSVPAGDAFLKLRGFSASDFGVTQNDLLMFTQEEILKNDINPDTGQRIPSSPIFVTFPEMNFNSVLSGNYMFPFMIDVCYKYRTIANSELCIKENLMDQKTDICVVSGFKTIENSGSPIHVLEFQEFTAGPDAVSFSFKVKNVGNGLISRKDSACDDTPANKDIVRLTVNTGLTGITCSGLSNPESTATTFSGDAKLTTGERIVRCTQPLSADEKADMIKLVEIFVDYDYQESVSTNVLVKHI